jgi:hypothetical protein
MMTEPAAPRNPAAAPESGRGSVSKACVSIQHLRRSGLVLALSGGALGCPVDTTGPEADGTGDASGIDPTFDASTSGAPTSDETSASADVSDTSGEDASSTTSACPGEPNPCGGCTDLPQVPGEACNGCDDLEWTCDGTDALVCDGVDPDATRWFPDEDGDGYGDETHSGELHCDAPPDGWVEDDRDCRDDIATANPDGTEVCNDVDDDCDGATDEGPTEFCTDVCCSFELGCDGTACVPKCARGTEVCGADLDICCNEGEICFADSCVEPGDTCEFTEECPVGQVCAQATGQCVPDDVVPECEFVPPVGEFNPTISCRTSTVGLTSPTRDDVVATPVVIDLTGDEVPEIATLTYDLGGDGCCNSRSTLRIYEGVCQPDGTMTHLADIDETHITAFNQSGYYISNDSGIAAGDLDGDGVPELVAITKSTLSNNVNGTIAFRRAADDGTAWEVLWHNLTYPTWNVHTRGGATISIADLDADGLAEVVVGNLALDGQVGTLLWDGDVAASAGGYTGGIGNNGFLGPSSAVADMDLDGYLEIAAGNTVYEHDGSVKWEYTYVGSNSSCGGQIPCDGFTAIANFDDDDEGEVVIVRLGEVFVLDDDGTELHRASIPVDNCNANEGGPPTVADFDGDGRPEIGTASSDYYVVVDWDCDPAALPAECVGDWIRWQATNEDCSSRVTGSSVFDFEGDGAAEVIYADETTMRIFDGSTGAVLFTDDTHNSHTRIEMPVIADVDDDGNAEIVIPENGTSTGLVVWEDAADNWVRTRRVWNQHGYHITHVETDGTIPAVPEVNWLNERFNNYRQNVQPDGLFHAPDAAIEGSICSVVEDGDTITVDVSILVRNLGALSIPAGTPVDVILEDGGVQTLLGQTFTTIELQPGQFEVLAVSLAVPDGTQPPFALRIVVDPATPESPAGLMNECDEANNAFETDCATPG